MKTITLGIWSVFCMLLAFSLPAHAEYYLVYGGAPEVIDLTPVRVVHHRCHHHRKVHHKRHYVKRRYNYHVAVYHYVRPVLATGCCGANYVATSGCCGNGYIEPVAPVKHVVSTGYYPIHSHGVVFTSQPDLYTGPTVNRVAYSYYSNDQRTGDDVGAELNIDY